MTPTPSPAIRIAAAQLHCVPGDVEQNLGRIRGLVAAAAAEGAQLVVVPETATTGYFIADRLAQLAEPEDGPSAQRLASLAAEHGVHLAVGMAIAEAGKYYDAQLLFGPDGTRLATYRKVHLFAAERQWYAAADEPIVVETAIGRIGMSICYDLMFPEFIRKLVDLGADLVINSTNWITNDFQRGTWGWTGSAVEALARTRALENGVWLAMADCVGPEAGFDSLGHSCVVAPSGKVLASAGDAQGIAAADIRYQSGELEQWRAIATYRGDRRHDLYR
ncbi:MAG TPA: carbon-nitrogen hydrolase family protein [Devosiaceae bacterium]|jgi:predicted amidohydrolase|nr:carbon-nitrogen hydrolase family protein [Devosiaceae bacterium]